LQETTSTGEEVEVVTVAGLEKKKEFHQGKRRKRANAGRAGEGRADEREGPERSPLSLNPEASGKRGGEREGVANEVVNEKCGEREVVGRGGAGGGGTIDQEG
jgi:hypothetical protein